MALTDAALTYGGSFAVTGGTSITFASTGKTIDGGLELIDTVTADSRTKVKIVVKSVPATYNSNTKTWGKAKWSIKIEIPSILADGSMSFAVCRMEFDVHPEVEAAVKNKLLDLMCNLRFDADFATYLSTGGLQ